MTGGSLEEVIIADDGVAAVTLAELLLSILLRLPDLLRAPDEAIPITAMSS